MARRENNDDDKDAPQLEGDDDDDDEIKDCIKVTESMKWVTSISRPNILKDVLALSTINMKNHGDNNNNIHNHSEDDAHTNDVEPKGIKKRKNRPPLLTHIHEKEEKSKEKKIDHLC